MSRFSDTMHSPIYQTNIGIPLIVEQIQEVSEIYVNICSGQSRSRPLDISPP